MNPRLRAILVVGLASVGSVWMGVAIAHGEYLLASIAAVLCLWTAWSRVSASPTEAWILAFLVCGYIIGNRGFAQIAPAGGLPLFFGELGLGASIALVGFRHAMRRELPWRRDWLNSLLVLLLVLGAGRMIFDLPSYGIVALRDFAALYYAIFFFIAQSIAQEENARRLLSRALTVTFVALPITALLAELFPAFFFNRLTVAGIPVILYKGDLLSTFQFAGFIWLLPRGPADIRHNAWRWLMALASLVAGFNNLSRAGMMGLLVALAFLAAARWFRPVVVTLAVSVCGLLGSFAYSLVQEKSISQTRAYYVYEHLQSLVDVDGTRIYAHPDTADSGDNNRFRLVWWKTIVNETLSASPFLGLGFGHDIAHGFVQAYDPMMEGDFTARSPHSILFTIFARMGLVGLVVFLAVMIVLVITTVRLARHIRSDPSGHNREPLVLLAVAWTVLTSACFGVVLEGPMGAIPFWIILGLAHARISQILAPAAERVTPKASFSVPQNNLPAVT